MSGWGKVPHWPSHNCHMISRLLIVGWLLSIHRTTYRYRAKQSSLSPDGVVYTHWSSVLYVFESAKSQKYILDANHTKIVLVLFNTYSAFHRISTLIAWWHWFTFSLLSNYAKQERQLFQNHNWLSRHRVECHSLWNIWQGFAHFVLEDNSKL